MDLLGLLLLAFGPSLVWLYWLWSRDKFQREPLGMVGRLVVGGGVLSVSLVMLVVPLLTPYLPPAESSPLLHMLLVAGLPEEIAKLLPVLLFAWWSPHWDEPFDGIVYAGASALGFHLVETGVYMARGAGESLAAAFYQGMIRGSKPGHMLYGVAMGYFLSRAKFAPLRQKPKYFALALAVPVALHTAWNAAAAYGGNFVGGESVSTVFFSLVAWGLSVAMWVIAFQYMKENQDSSPWNPQGWTAPVADVPCPSCGSSYPAGSSYCHVCGTSLYAAAPAISE